MSSHKVKSGEGVSVVAKAIGLTRDEIIKKYGQKTDRTALSRPGDENQYMGVAKNGALYFKIDVTVEGGSKVHKDFSSPRAARWFGESGNAPYQPLSGYKTLLGDLEKRMMDDTWEPVLAYGSLNLKPWWQSEGYWGYEAYKLQNLVRAGLAAGMTDAQINGDWKQLERKVVLSRLQKAIEGLNRSDFPSIGFFSNFRQGSAEQYVKVLQDALPEESYQAIKQQFLRAVYQRLKSEASPALLNEIKNGDLILYKQYELTDRIKAMKVIAKAVDVDPTSDLRTVYNAITTKSIEVIKKADDPSSFRNAAENLSQYAPLSSEPPREYQEIDKRHAAKLYTLTLNQLKKYCIEHRLDPERFIHIDPTTGEVRFFDAQEEDSDEKIFESYDFVRRKQPSSIDSTYALSLVLSTLWASSGVERPLRPVLQARSLAGVSDFRLKIDLKTMSYRVSAAIWGDETKETVKAVGRSVLDTAENIAENIYAAALTWIPW